ncbi:MAG: prephenate dehydrogenase/arogenate dehydrogenase family protein, partial [Clostridia bacterium]|nr:prephenate dehydrogenase/arogenate dehydrogenase family protein [Clostridia bacterium]
ANYHDSKIAYTSQLAHIVSNAYVKNKSVDNCGGFTGGSWQDMTRVATLDPALWTQLFFVNRKNLTEELEELIGNLNDYLTALKENDREKMKELLAEGSKKRRELKENKRV